MFLALSYFGTDQSQVQRYISGASLRESRLGLMFNAVFKIPMQFFILLLGVLLFVFYQFERPPVFLQPGRLAAMPATHGSGDQLRAARNRLQFAPTPKKQKHVQAWLAARHAGDSAAAETARTAALAANTRTEAARVATKAALRAADATTGPTTPTTSSSPSSSTHLPHGLIGLLVAVIFAAALSSKAGELNALGSTTTVDFYRHVDQDAMPPTRTTSPPRNGSPRSGASFAIGFALFASLAENLIQAINIVGSIFYGVVLGLFLVAFFLRKIGGTAVFWAAVAAQSTRVRPLLHAQHFLSLVQRHRLRRSAWCSAPSSKSFFRKSRRLRRPPATLHFHSSPVPTSPVICFGQQPCGFFPRRFLFAKIETARRLQAEIGGEIVFFYHDSDHDPRETQTILRHRKTGEPATLNFTFDNKLQRKFSPLFLKRIPADWQANTARQLPNYVDRRWVEAFKQTTAANVADFCLEMYRRMGLLEGIRVVRSSDPAVRRAACDVADFFVDVPHEGEIVRARLHATGAFKLHEGGDFLS